ncbi:MAG: hypothetical protein J5752_05460 [Clostridiales bacterium]|nr:hypothetical protein [Clostridiales bacterium]
MVITMKNLYKNTAELVKHNRAVRYALYAVLILLTAKASFELGTHFGEFIYTIAH